MRSFFTNSNAADLDIGCFSPVIVDNNDEFAIVPRRPSVWTYAPVFILDLAVTAAAIFFITRGNFVLGMLVLVPGGAIAGATVIATRALLNKALQRGPWLSYRRQERRLLLPRHNATIEHCDLSHFRLVVGRPEDSARDRAELQAVCHDHGAWRAVPIIRDLGQRPLRRLIAALDAPAFEIRQRDDCSSKVKDLRTDTELSFIEYQSAVRHAAC